MSDPVPLNYGQANWQDFNNNWRKKDGDFLQTRSVLRYETTVARDAIVDPQPGMTIYNAQTDRLEVRVTAAGGSWNGLFSVDGLIIEKIGAGTDVKLRHVSTSSSNGMIFSNNLIATQVPFTTGGGEVRMDSTGLTIKTGTLSSKLTTDATDLIVSTRIKTPYMWSTGHLWVDQTSTFIGNVQANTSMTVHGLLTANGQISISTGPTAASHATRKDYVDANDANRVYKYGDSMLGALYISAGAEALLHIVGTPSPYISWHQTGVGRRAYLQATPTWMIVGPEGANGVYFAGNVGGQAWIQYQHSVFSGMAIGRGAHGWPSLWVNGEDSNGGYRLLSYGAETYVNATSAVGIRISNQDRCRIGTQAVEASNVKFQATYASPSHQWNYAHLVAYDWGGVGGHISMFHPSGYATQIRCGPGRDSVDSVNWDQSNYSSLYCTFVYQTSALRFKKGVRALRPKRIPATVWHDSVTDEVALPNVMALRPVVYRAADEPMRVKYDGESEHEAEPEPLDTVWGREYRRERLGLIADEVQHVLPSAVGHDADGEPEAIAYDQIIVALLDHVQQLTERLETAGRRHEQRTRGQRARDQWPRCGCSCVVLSPSLVAERPSTSSPRPHRENPWQHSTSVGCKPT